MYSVAMCLCCNTLFFVKQKTAYDLRISDWSSDVCSSDLGDRAHFGTAVKFVNDGAPPFDHLALDMLRARCRSMDHETQRREVVALAHRCRALQQQIGRASCRDRVCQYV